MIRSSVLALCLLCVAAHGQDDAGRAKEAVKAAAMRHGIPHEAPALLAVAYRESRYRPYAFNGSSGARGLFQIKPHLWMHATWRMGRPHLNPWRTEDQAEVAAWCWAHGLRGHWSVGRKGR